MKVDAVRMMTMTALMAAAMSTTAFAGSWRTDGGGRWYQNDDGSCTKNGWQWIDSDNDGYSECFYFDSNGYVLTNTRTPDGSQVNGIGAMGKGRPCPEPGRWKRILWRKQRLLVGQFLLGRFFRNRRKLL